jgi:type I restriction-modification system DNA methylase subunit
MIDKITAKKRISDLVTRFEEQYSSYRNSNYNETQTRRDFIDPFFKSLGWDIDNEEGYAEAYREVIHEDKVKVSGATKAPDYSFRLVGGKRLFFVEAKKPSVSVKDDIQPAYQIRRYGWSAKHPISIITDFEEFAIYDCTKKPKPDDKPSVARIKYITYQNYLKEFDFIWETFSKEQVLKGSFDKFVQSDINKKGTASVDKDFLESLDRWRTYLAVNISWNNKNLDEDEINFAVQQTIDRIIFLRIAEDRSVEPYGNLKHAIRQGNLYSNLFDQFKKADEKYNSGLFDLKKDKICENIKIENKVIKTIINELYYPESPYEFSVLPVEILGSAYEQFLGKVIRITTFHHAKIEEKPEVRKAGGVYYTPQYIVDYIVKNTVGKLIVSKSPKEISKIKIVDPACGSGSFLIGAFQYLLDYHKNYYSGNGKISKGKKDNPLTPEGHLTTAEKKRILLNNIFGVDLDINAVEVTKLSLLLKCMEGETEASIQQQFKLWNERVLPTLENNIKSGNSLIDTDFYESAIDFGDEKRIKPFSWTNSFSEVFADGGFDIVIGNPPYGASLFESELKYFKENFKSAVWRGESYLLFIEKGIKLLKLGGILGLIIPDTILNLGFTESTRDYILKNSKLTEIVLLPSNVFTGATVDTIIIVSQKDEIAKSFHPSNVSVKIFNKKKSISNISDPDRHFSIQSEIWFQQKSFNLQSNLDETNIIKKIETKKKRISDIAEMYSGIKAYEVGKGSPPQTTKIRDEKPFTSKVQQTLDWKPFYDGKHIGRYQINWNRNNWIHYGKWLAAPRNAENFEGEKILIRKITSKTLIATYVHETSYCNTLLFVLKIKDISFSYLTITGILNSSLIGWYFRKKFQISDDDTFPQIMIRDILEFPIPDLEKNKDQEISNYVETIINLNNELANTKLQSKIEQLKTKLDFYEEKLNKIIFKIYGVNDVEKKIVEGDS